MEIELRRDGAAARADTHGGELFSYCTPGGEQVIWGGDPASWSGRSPVLFQLIGGVRDRITQIDGRCTKVKNHGFGRNLEYEITAQTEYAVALRARETEYTLSVFPWPFALEITHALTGRGFVTRYRVTNTGERAFSYCIGGHVGLCCPRGGDAFEDYELLFPQPTAVHLLPVQTTALPAQQTTRVLRPEVSELALERGLFDQGTLYLEQPGLHTVTLRSRKSGHGVTMDYSGFPIMAFWTKEGAAAPFVCIEPWHGLPEMEGESGRFEDKPYLIPLVPGESCALEYTVSIF